VSGPSIQLLASETTKTNVLALIGAYIGFGLLLFYGIQKFFEEIEKKLSGDTKLEIAFWLLDLPPTKTIHAWYATFPKIFNTIFGDKHWSWRCFWRSCTATTILVAGTTLPYFLGPDYPWRRPLSFSCGIIIASIIPDYVSLWKTRFLLILSQGISHLRFQFLLLLLDICITLVLVVCAAFIGINVAYYSIGVIMLSVPLSLERFLFSLSLASQDFIPRLLAGRTLWLITIVWFIPAFAGRLWLLMFVVCSLLLRSSRRMDLGFAWLNPHLDVENRPLQFIGQVAATISALGYWILAAIHLML
jgi:hypothetical protein